MFPIDVVRAYKGLLKEKEALESSLRALSTRTSTPSRDRSHDQTATLLNVTLGEQENCTSDGETIDSQQSTTEEEGGKNSGLTFSSAIVVCLYVCTTVYMYRWY